MDVYAQMATKIIEQQEAIIGPVAAEQAEGINGLKVDWDKRQVVVTGDGKSAIDKLVSRYQGLFGQVSVEVCKSAIVNMLPKLTPEQLPKSLR
jgi:hypothetical protein